MVGTHRAAFMANEFGDSIEQTKAVPPSEAISAALPFASNKDNALDIVCPARPSLGLGSKTRRKISMDHLHSPFARLNHGLRAVFWHRCSQGAGDRRFLSGDLFEHGREATARELYARGIGETAVDHFCRNKPDHDFRSVDRPRQSGH